MLLKQSASYGVGRGLAAVFALASIAVFSRLLSPAAYGDYVLLLATGTLVNVIAFQWIRVSALRFIPHYPQEQERVLRTLLGAFLGVAAVLVGLGLAVLPFIRPATVVTVVALALALGWFELEQDIARTDLAPWRYGRLTVGRAALGFGFGYVLVEAGLGGFGPVAGAVIAMVLSALFFSRHKRWSMTGRLSRPMLSQFLGYGAPLVVAYALDFVVATSDRFLLLWLSTKEATGLYSAGYDLAFRTVGFATVVVGLAALPLAVARLESEGPEAARTQLGRNRDALLLVTVPVVLMVALYAGNISGIMLGPDFADEAGRVVPLIAISGGLLALKSYFADHAIHLQGRTRLLALVTAGAAIVNVIANLWLIPRYGEVGAAISTLIAYSVGLLGALAVAHRLFGLPPITQDAIRVGLAGAVLLAVGWQLRSSRGPLALAGQTLGCAVIYLVVLVVSDFGGARGRVAMVVRRLRG